MALTRKYPWYGWTGVGILVAGETGLVLGALAIRVAFYFIAWWSYILLVDAWVWKRRGWSLLRDRPREFLVLAFWSVPVWNLFEAINFRLQNWFYVNVPAGFPDGFLPSCLAYATVLPGLFETYDLLRVWQVAEGLRMRPWRIRPRGLVLCAALGASMLAAPLAWPRYTFPLVWGFAAFLVDPLCYWAAPSRPVSLLSQFEHGDPRPFLRLLLAGLICGGLWEFWNYWAVTKWIYTVPFVGDWKWFEMPILGFLGFPPFTIESYVLMNGLNLMRRGRGWEEPSRTGPGARRSLAGAAIVLAMVFNLAVYAGIDRWTVQSYLPVLAEMTGVPTDLALRLQQAGVSYPETLLRRTRTAEALAELARQSGVPEATLEWLRRAARLVDLKGLGAAHFNELQRLGISRVSALAHQDPDELTRRWRQLAVSRPPTRSQVRVWIRAARQETAGTGG